MEVPAPYSAFSDTTVVEGLGACYSWERMEVRTSCLVFAGMCVCVCTCVLAGGGARGQSHSFFCDAWLEYSSHYLDIFCLAKLPFS